MRKVFNNLNIFLLTVVLHTVSLRSGLIYTRPTAQFLNRALNIARNGCIFKGVHQMNQPISVITPVYYRVSGELN